MVSGREFFNLFFAFTMDEATKNDFKEFIKETMKEQSVAILKTAQHNSNLLIEKKLSDNTKKIQDDIDLQMEHQSSREHSFRNNINSSNFDFCKQIDDIWRKADRAREDRDEARMKELFDKGKQLIDNRKQALVIADREGWDVALGYLADPIVRTADQEKLAVKAVRVCMRWMRFQN